MTLIIIVILIPVIIAAVLWIWLKFIKNAIRTGFQNVDFENKMKELDKVSASLDEYEKTIFKDGEQMDDWDDDEEWDEDKEFEELEGNDRADELAEDEDPEECDWNDGDDDWDEDAQK